MKNIRIKSIISLVLTMVLLFTFLLTFTGCSSGKNPIVTQKNPKDSQKNPIVTLEIENSGTIKIELYPKTAPNTVNNFISLVQSGFYDGLTFHRVIPDFMVQGGDPLGNGKGDPGYSIKGEFTENGFTNDLKHTRGVISMARGGYDMDSAGSQFFIVVAEEYPSLDGKYASFGKVIEGMETVDKIVSVETNEDDKPLKDQIIKKATVELFEEKYTEPKKIN